MQQLEILEITVYPILCRAQMHRPCLTSLTCALYSQDVAENIPCLPSCLRRLEVTVVGPFPRANQVVTAIGGRLSLLEDLILHMPAYTPNYSVKFFRVEALRALSAGCPCLHSLTLPVCVDFGPGAVAVLADFPSLRRVCPWVHHESAVRDMGLVLRASASIEEVLFLGFGPEDADWADLAGGDHLARMVEWHAVKRRVRNIGLSFPRVSIDAVVVEDR